MAASNKIEKHPFMKITMAGNRASMDFFGAIMDDEEPDMDDKGQPIPGVKFGAYSNALKAMKSEGVTDLDMLINTPGGSIDAGMAMYDLNKASGLKINCKVIGVCASMGTVLMLSGDELPEATPGALFMFHKPKAGEMGEASKLRETADLLDKMEARIMSIYCEAFNMDEADVKKWMKPGANKWMTAKEALDNGIIRGIVDRPGQGSNAPANITKPNARMSAQDAFKKFYTQPTTQTPNMKFKKTTYDKLKITANAEETEVEQAIETLIAEKEATELKLDKMEKAQKAENRTRAVMLVDKAIADKRILAIEKDEYVNEAENNYAFVEKTLSKMKPAGNIKAQMREDNSGGGNESDSDFKLTEAERKYTYRDFEKKASKRLAQMKVDDFELFNKLHIEEYGVPAKK